MKPKHSTTNSAPWAARETSNLDLADINEWTPLMKGFIPPTISDTKSTNSGDSGGPSLDDVQWIVSK